MFQKTILTEFANSVDLDEAALRESPHLDLHWLPSSLWSLNIISLTILFFNFADASFTHYLFTALRVNLNRINFLVEKIISNNNNIKLHRKRSKQILKSSFKSTNYIQNESVIMAVFFFFFLLFWRFIRFCGTTYMYQAADTYCNTCKI